MLRFTPKQIGAEAKDMIKEYEIGAQKAAAKASWDYKNIFEDSTE